jgi:hypothetical protein
MLTTPRGVDKTLGFLPFVDPALAPAPAVAQSREACSHGRAREKPIYE